MQGALADCFKRFATIGKLVMLLLPGKVMAIIEDTKINERYSIDLVKKWANVLVTCEKALINHRRINKKTDRKDFLTRILEHRDENNVSDIQIAAHASDFVLAGSETTATALSCITYYLLHTPHALKALTDEIDGAFKSYGEINAMSTSSLKYLQAVCLEGMRIYSPLPFALPRVVPAEGDTVDGHFLPAGVSENSKS